MMDPIFALGALALLSKAAGNGGNGGGWRQLAPNSKGQYAVPAGSTFVVELDAGSPVAPLLTKQIQDMGGQVMPPTVPATAMPIDWPANDDMRTATGRMRGAAKAGAALAIDMGAAPRPTRVWVK
jgi:hypothetical protein